MGLFGREGDPGVAEAARAAEPLDLVAFAAVNPYPAFSRDCLASLVVFLAVLPLCMAIAIAAGVPPAAGLLTGIIGGPVVGFLAGVRLARQSCRSAASRFWARSRGGGFGHLLSIPEAPGTGFQAEGAPQSRRSRPPDRLLTIQHIPHSHTMWAWMHRRDFLETATALPAAAQSQPKRRNIVFVLADDHRYDFTGALGHPWLKGLTPNLDRMVRRGVLFRNAFVTSSLCSPSRASILTSLYMHQHRVSDNFSPLDTALPTFPAMLQKAGYRTGFFGKWHMGGAGDEQRPGFDRWVSFRGQGEYANPELNIDGERRREPGNTTDILTSMAARFIRENASRPFLVYLSHKAVHAPFQAPDRHSKLFDGMPVPRPRTMPYKEEFYRKWPEWVRRRRVTRHGVDGMIDSDEPFDVHYRRYCQCLIALDESLGRIFRQLEESRVLEDTLLVYMGDNGYMWGEHGLVDKRAMYEASIRVPLFAHCPSLFGTTGRTVDPMVLNLDLAPTFLDVAGVAPARGMQGRSLAPLGAGRTPADWRRDFLYQYAWEQDFPYTPNIVGLRTATHSLMHYPGAWDMAELYDIQKDPEQIDNLVADARIGPRMRGRWANHVSDPRTRSLVDGLQARLEQILKDTGGDPRLAGRTSPDDKYAY